MLGTFVVQRFYLHIVPIKHLFVAGCLVHHLFIGLLLKIPASFILAFGPRNRLVGFVAPLALGIGTAMILDEAIYLVAMEAAFVDPEKTGDFYRTPVSVWGAIILISIAGGLLLLLDRLHARLEKASEVVANGDPPAS
jgi:hypothetical protein